VSKEAPCLVTSGRGDGIAVHRWRVRRGQTLGAIKDKTKHKRLDFGSVSKSVGGKEREGASMQRSVKENAETGRVLTSGDGKRGGKIGRKKRRAES